ncbi:MAG: carboxypeptidase regulatory-like domain-containing protein, partial [Acidobacteriaceae bacterium]|nr:carboxypeptidase regulatory-like domain-containing protein [Acidobacteriaceae bacterium]
MLTIFRLSVVLLLPLTLLAQGQGPQELPGSVEGRVSNAQTGDAIPGASLHLYPLLTHGGARGGRDRQAPAATSQPDGGFRFEGVAPGTYFVSAERDGFVAPAPNGPPPGISVSAGQQVTNISVLLNPQGVIR